MKGGIGSAVAGVWGLAEATVFFLVPDVWLTFLALRNLRQALAAAAWALGGALAGGLAMFLWGAQAHEWAAHALDAVPAISPALIARVHEQIDAHGLLAVLLGPIGGVPYKIYAVDWGGRHGDWLPFLLVSVPARGMRFFLAPVAVAALQRLAGPPTRRSAAIGTALLAAFWVGFYALYFVVYRG